MGVEACICNPDNVGYISHDQKNLYPLKRIEAPILEVLPAAGNGYQLCTKLVGSNDDPYIRSA